MQRENSAHPLVGVVAVFDKGRELDERKDAIVYRNHNAGHFTANGPTCMIFGIEITTHPAAAVCKYDQR